MANTKVTEAYFMANVTTNAVENSKKAQTEGFSFEQLMNNATDKNKDSIATEDSNPVKTSSGMTCRKPVSDKAELAGNPKEQKISDNPEKAAEEILEGGNTVKEKIKEILGVTDEEIEEVMASMGIVVTELLNPETLKEVMVTLSGVEDSMELLTNENLYSGMQDILKTADAVVNDIAQGLGMDKESVIALATDAEFLEKVQMDVPEELVSTDNVVVNENQVILAGTDNVKNADHANGQMTTEQNTTVTSENGDESNANVTVQTAGNTEKLETFRNVAKSNESENNNEQGMSSMTQTTVTINAEGELVETVQKFTEGFNDAREIISQVTEHIKLDFTADSTTMEMQLHPATLGTVNMQISSQNGVVTAHILVENEAVKSAIETQFITLQETFEEQGHHVEAVEVSVANYDLNRGMHSGADEQERENALRSGRAARRRLKLDEISDEDMEKLTEDDKVTADMMRRQGNSVDFMA